MAGFLVLARRGLKHMPRGILKRINPHRVRVLIYRYRQFPGFGLLATFISAVSRNMPIIGLGYFFSPAIVGFFAMAFRLVAGPVQIGANSITRVFFERANRSARTGDLASLTLTAFQRLTIIVMTPMALLCIAAPELIALLLGDQWSESGIYLRWITLWLFFVATGSPLHRIFTVTEKQHELAYLNGFLFIVSGAAIVVGGMIGNAEQTVAAFCLSSSAVWMLFGFRVIQVAGARIQAATQIMLKEVAITLPFAGAMALVRYATPDPVLVTLAFFVLLAVFGISRVRNILSAKRHE
jgi:O-antigen/teichoic acid export membrane protein